MARVRTEARVNSIVRDVKRYAERYRCSLGDAFEDIINDGPCFRPDAEAAALALGLDIAADWMEGHTKSDMYEVNQYYNELYDN